MGTIPRGEGATEIGQLPQTELERTYLPQIASLIQSRNYKGAAELLQKLEKGQNNGGQTATASAEALALPRGAEVVQPDFQADLNKLIGSKSEQVASLSLFIDAAKSLGLTGKVVADTAASFELIQKVQKGEQVEVNEQQYDAAKNYLGWIGSLGPLILLKQEGLRILGDQSFNAFLRATGWRADSSILEGHEIWNIDDAEIRQTISKGGLKVFVKTVLEPGFVHTNGSKIKPVIIVELRP